MPAVSGTMPTISMIPIQLSIQTQSEPQTQSSRDDLLYNRQIASAVLSWDTGCYDAPELHVHPDDITGISIKGDMVFYQINYHRAVSLLIKDFHRYWDAIQKYRKEQDRVEVQVKRQQLEQTVQSLKNYGSAVVRALKIGTNLGVAFNWINPDGKNEIMVWASPHVSPLLGLAPFCFRNLEENQPEKCFYANAHSEGLKL